MSSQVMVLGALCALAGGMFLPGRAQELDEAHAGATSSSGGTLTGESAPACAEPAAGLAYVNTGMRTCLDHNCDTIVGDELLFGCFPRPNVNDPSLCVHDLTRRVTVESVRGWPGFLDGAVSLEIYEGNEGRDMNGDGDLNDVHLLLRPRSAARFLPTGFNHPPASPGGWPFLSTPSAYGDGILAFQAYEWRMGDMNGDGDRNDQILQVHLAGFAGTLNTGIEGQVVEVRGDRIYLLTRERDFFEANGVDLNGDGDQDDEVLQIVTVARPAPTWSPFALPLGSLPIPIDAGDLTVFNTRTASSTLLLATAETVYWGVSERHQRRDLDSDGSIDGNVLHRLGLDTDEVENTGIPGFPWTLSSDSSRLVALDLWRSGGNRLLVWDLGTGEVEERGLFSWVEDVDGPRLLLWEPYAGNPWERQTTVYDVDSDQSWFAGYLSHPGAGRLRGGRVALHRDATDCYGGWLGSFIEFIDYTRGNWKATGLAGAFYVQPQIRGPILAFNSNEFLSQKDLDGDGVIDWGTSVETYVVTTSDWPDPPVASATGSPVPKTE